MEILSHKLVPKHEILPETEVKQLLSDLNIKLEQLPKILPIDPIVQLINAKTGDVLRITRNSPTAGKSVYYRIVVD